MSNLDHKIESDGWQYEATPLTDPSNFLSRTTLTWYAHFVKAFEDAQKTWEQRIKDEGLQYADTFGLYSMVLDIEGIPSALIAHVDDVVQVFSIRQIGRIPKDEVPTK